MKQPSKHLPIMKLTQEIFEGDLTKEQLRLVLQRVKEGTMYVTRVGSWSGEWYFSERVNDRS